VGTPGGGTAPYEDGTASYSYLTARALGADFTAICCSGIGIDLGHTNNPNFNNPFSMDDYYPCTSFYRSRTEMYDFASARAADIVVINLGTNDAQFSSNVAIFKAGVKALIEYIRANYGADTPIVWVYNMMGDGYFTHTRVTLEELGGEGAGLYSVRMSQNNGGGNGHPSGRSHELVANRLTEFLKHKGLVPKNN
jgi:hypothetical protein